MVYLAIPLFMLISVLALMGNVLISTVVAASYIVAFLGVKGWEKALEKRCCPHGVPYGKTLGRCGRCLEEQKMEAEKQKREAEKAEILRKALLLREQERIRLEAVKLVQLRNLDNPDNFQNLSPQELEDFVARLFECLGYEVRQTPYSGDGGKDIIAFKDGRKYIIECKRYKKEKVGRPELQKFFGVMNEEGADGGFFVTTGQFTQTAVKYAQKYGIRLVNADELARLTREVFLSDDSNFARVMCLECGAIVTFSLLMPEAKKKCPNGHLVENNLIGFAKKP